MKLPRYPKYKASGVKWLGQVPEHWGHAHLRWISRRYAGGTPDKTKIEYWTDGTIPWLNSGAVNDPVITEPSSFITEEALRNSSARWIPANSLLIALAGQGKTKGMVAQLAFRSTCNQSMAAIIPNELTNVRFLYWWLTSNYQNIRNLAGGDLRDGLNLELLGSIDCPVLPLAEQTLIASFLDEETKKIDALIAEQHRLIESLKGKRLAIIALAATKGLNSNAPMKRSGVEWLGEVPAHWEIKSLKRLALKGRRTFTDGDWIELPYITDQGVRLIQTGNIGIGFYKEQGFRYISEGSFAALKCTEVLPGNVLICRLDGPVGRGCIAPSLSERMITSVDNTILKVNEAVDPRYVVYLLSSEPWLKWIEVLCRVGGGFRVRVSRTMLGNLQVPCPPHSEQLEIADQLDKHCKSINELLSEAEVTIDRLQDRRSALISATVTGQIDVRSYRPEEAPAACQ